MVEPLIPPRRKDPRKRTAVATAPPGTRSRAARYFSAFAARGEFRLQHCSDCGAVQYPPCDACVKCSGVSLSWALVGNECEILAETTLRASVNTYYRQKTPWRIGTVKLKSGVIVIAHLHGDVCSGDRAKIIARTDRSGEGVLMALPEKETNNMADDKAYRALTCAPKHRRILITDAVSPVGQAIAAAAVRAGASTVFLGMPQQWLSFEGKETLLALPNVEVAPLDLTDSESVAKLAASIGGRTDILINTAQYVRPGGVFDRKDVNVAREEMEINFFGALRLLQAFGPAMRSRGDDGDNNACAYVNCVSAYAFSNWPVFGVNSASQAAALSLAQNARAEFAGSGVKVVNVFHGPIDDEWAQTLYPPKVSPEKLGMQVMDALQRGLETVFVGDIAEEIYEKWKDAPDVLERDLRSDA